MPTREGSLELVIAVRWRNDRERRWRYLKPFPATDAGHEALCRVMDKIAKRPRLTAFWFTRDVPVKQRTLVGLIGEDFGIAAAPCSIDEMFRTPRFRACREWVEQFCDDWGVLTVSTGLVVSGQKAETYEGKVHNRSVGSRRRWAAMVRQQVSEMWPDGEFIIFGSKIHLDALRGLPRIDPLSGVPRRLHRKWMLAQLGEGPSGPAKFHLAWPAGGGTRPVPV